MQGRPALTRSSCQTQRLHTPGIWLFPYTGGPCCGCPRNKRSAIRSLVKEHDFWKLPFEDAGRNIHCHLTSSRHGVRAQKHPILGTWTLCAQAKLWLREGAGLMSCTTLQAPQDFPWIPNCSSSWLPRMLYQAPEDFLSGF